MTREEALEWFKDRKKMNLDDKCQQAEDMAIEALEQEPCGDAISRKAVLQMIEDIQDAGGFIGCSTYSEAFDMVDNMPPVTPTCKKGKWINGDPICPCCGEDKFKDLDADIWADWQPKYCPNCGAKMEESEAKNDKERSDSKNKRPYGCS